MTRRSIAAMVALGFLATACGGSGEDPSTLTAADPATAPTSAGGLDRNGGWMSGRATDAASGTPVAGVVVAAGGRSATTAADGTYTFQLLAGTYTATATRSGYATATQSVTVRRKATTTVDWSLTPAQVACSLHATARGAPASRTGPRRAQVPHGDPLRLHRDAGPDAVLHLRTPDHDADRRPPSRSSRTTTSACTASTRASPSSPSCRPTTSSTPRWWRSRAPGKPDRPRPDAGRRPVLGHRRRDRLDQLDQPREERLLARTPSPLYGAALSPGQGLQGMWMPKDAPNAAGTTLAWDPAHGALQGARASRSSPSTTPAR